jgi:predicted nucleotide-binding protein (sugar kinase/HSP70/actin superfamily)
LGNFVEAVEAGAEALLMVGGIGPCRLGYYCELQREIMRDLKSRAELLVLEPFHADPGGLLRQVARIAGRVTPAQAARALWLGWEKTIGLDQLDQAMLAARWGQMPGAAVTSEYRSAIAALDEADSVRAVRDGVREGLSRIRSCSLQADSSRPHLRVGVVGEMYVVLETAVNLDIPRRLGELGAEVLQPITLSSWVRQHVVMDFLRMGKKSDTAALARPYLNYFVGGHGLESVGHAVEMARAGVDGVVHLAPLTCMPEIVAESILPSVSEREGIPVMSITLDEQTADAGIQTRIEAFVDLLAWRRRVQTGGQVLS